MNFSSLNTGENKHSVLQNFLHECEWCFPHFCIFSENVLFQNVLKLNIEKFIQSWNHENFICVRDFALYFSIGILYSSRLFVRVKKTTFIRARLQFAVEIVVEIKKTFALWGRHRQRVRGMNICELNMVGNLPFLHFNSSLLMWIYRKLQKTKVMIVYRTGTIWLYNYEVLQDPGLKLLWDIVKLKKQNLKYAI